MPKRLQVVLRDSEYREIQKAAHSRQMSIAEWTRQALARACSIEPSADVAKKLEVVRVAARHDFPTCEIDAMLADIEKGYRRQR